MTNTTTSGRDLKTKATIDLAYFFHVSCDYILRGIDTEFSDVHEATGLSNNALKKLQAYQESGIPQLFEAILTSRRIPELAGDLSNYLTYRIELANSTPPDFVQIETKSDHLARIKESVKENRVVLSAYAAKNYHMQRALDILYEIIEREL